MPDARVGRDARPRRDAPDADRTLGYRAAAGSRPTLESVSDPLTIAETGLCAGAFVLAASAHVRFRRLRKACTLLQGDSEQTSFMVAMARKTAEVERLRTEVTRLQHEFTTFRAAVDESLRRVAVLHYDAFGEMGGRLSWSVALLDENGDGLVLTTLVGRSDTRSYVKSINRGVAERDLAPEEIQVVEAALRPSRARVPGPLKRRSEAATTPTATT